MSSGEEKNIDLTRTVSRSRRLKVFGIVVFATIIATVVAVWTIMSYLFPDELKPVTLSAKEEKILNAKLRQLDSGKTPRISPKRRPQADKEILLKPERYTEEISNREIVLSEKELNSMLAKNTDLAKKLAIDLSDDMLSAKFLLPLHEDFPVLGGKTLKVTAGLELAYANGKPVISLRGVSVWGVPLPNAWLGNLKNVDLVKEFGDKNGFWKVFSEGIDEIKIGEKSLRIKVKE